MQNPFTLWQSHRCAHGGRSAAAGTRCSRPRPGPSSADPALTKIDAMRKRSLRTLGGHRKFRLFSADTANVLDPKSKAFKVVKIKTVVDSPANSNYVRRNILTKGTIIDTELGKARITSKPGQDSAVNAVLI